MDLKSILLVSILLVHFISVKVAVNKQIFRFAYNYITNNWNKSQGANIKDFTGKGGC